MEEEAEQPRSATRSTEKYLEKDAGEGKRVNCAEKEREGEREIERERERGGSDEGRNIRGTRYTHLL
jgi:hypothetical protein